MSQTLQTMSPAQLKKSYKHIINERIVTGGLLVVVLLFSLVLDLLLGPLDMGIVDLWNTLWQPESVSLGQRVVVWDIRLPYGLMAIVVGLSLGLAGAEMQTILNNPLASPFTLGVSSAASFGAALAIVLDISLFAVSSQWVVTVNAFVFAILAVLMLDGITRWTRGAHASVVLFGIALVFSFNSLVSLLQFVATEDTLQGLVFWSMGSLARSNWLNLQIMFVAFCLILPWSLMNSWKLTALRLGEDRAMSFGVNTKKLRRSSLLRISILSALAVAFVGPIGFIGLVSPHISRLIFGEDHRFYLLGSAVIGALVLSVTSILSRNLLSGVILPVGIVTSLVGVPFFLTIILRNRGRIG